ncbi:hypothetical protein [Gallibacterium sp. ZY190522]
MSCELNYEIKQLLFEQPKLKLIDDEKEFIIQGVYKYSLGYDGQIFQGERDIKLTVPKSFPNSIPQFYVYAYPKDMEHIYPDGSVCLATIGEMIYFLNENPSLKAFIEHFVHAFIYTLEWYERYRTYPFGDRKHGYKGLLDYYINDLKLTKEQYQYMVFSIYDNKYRGHMPCFCGSDKRLRDCHGKYMLPIIKNAAYRDAFLREACAILTEDGKNVRKQSSR